MTTSDGRVNKGTGGSRGGRARLWQEKGLIVKWMDGRMVRWKSNATGQSPTCRRVFLPCTPRSKCIKKRSSQPRFYVGPSANRVDLEVSKFESGFDFLGLGLSQTMATTIEQQAPGGRTPGGDFLVSCAPSGLSRRTGMP